jgi:EAL domain-containing protein (putative c-di-GMP-specific phosphodiesterase class I)
MHRQAAENMKTLSIVKEALASRRIVTYFQPIVENATREISKYESLVRLIDGEGNIRAPFFFLDVSKKGNLYHGITAQVLERSFEALSRCGREISVNLSARDIEHGTTRKKILQLLEKHRKVSHRLVFELLEDESIDDTELIKSFITHVKGYGVKIAIDDFGSGFSNYERLLEYQPDLLKIDGSLIRHLETSAYARSVVKSIVTFAEEQGLETVAEFVENENVFQLVGALGVDYSQGYHFGKPEPLPAPTG